jgi:hypothetical protein
VWVSVFFILGGFLFSATGIGAIIGVPMILVGFVFPFLGPFLGLAVMSLTGPCPYCGTTVTGGMAGFNCHACRKRIVVKDKKFIRVD